MLIIAYCYALKGNLIQVITKYNEGEFKEDSKVILKYNEGDFKEDSR